ncbi:MAG: LytTR family DNA-binding domain-containing protein [Candidatus Pseudobacter hemicellulosilyticus]|uniref:LytTR family DNA-binding domain-containing protein n=1 Tax=Candidatus Pseudobacter hemicellulosilyticus TaxID=3121375 RepID=A0AAJ5WUV3_9BACT|nr:MAG: LytTR family DNA-binding domain-containing protein [Pseudobacter sp.]
MITAIALDDEPPALEIIRAFCGRMEDVQLLQAFTSSTEAARYLEQQPVELLFLDINMPSISGIGFLKQLDPRPMVIFTTSYSEYAVESYELNALDYLVKPFTFLRFQQAVQKAVDARRLREQALPAGQEQLVLRVDYGLVKLPISSIRFIEGLDNYLKIHVKEGKPVVVRMTLKALLEKLPANAFLRVHRSFIVPLAGVSAVRNKLISLQCGEEIPLGSSYEEAFMQLFGQ